MRGALNAVSHESVRQKEFATTLAHVLGRPAFLPAPSFALRTALSGFAQELLASRRVLPVRTQKLGFSYRFSRLEDALRDAVAR